MPSSRGASPNSSKRDSKESVQSKRGGKEEDPWEKFFRKFSDLQSYKVMLETPSEDKANLCEAVSRICWERCQIEQEALRKRIRELNLNTM